MPCLCTTCWNSGYGLSKHLLGTVIMNRKEKLIIEDNYQLLVDNLDTKDINPYLFKTDVIDDETYLKDIAVRELRVVTLLKHVIDNCPFDVFLEALLYNDSYPFLAEKLRNDKGAVHRLQKVSLQSSRRVKAMQFRHELKRCTHQRDYDTFDHLYNKAVDNWTRHSQMHHLRPAVRQEYADMYFMAIDAKIEQRRVLFDKTLHKSELFEKLEEISPHTSHPSLPSIMMLSRLGTSILMAGQPTDDALGYVHQAKQVIEEGLLPPCRETGLVIYIEFNVELQINEKNQLHFDKEKFALLGKRAIEHFGEEAETVGNDFKRILLMKMAHVDLGMGLFLNFVEEVDDVSQEHLKRAESILQELRNEEMWCRMELRANMVYNAIESRIMQLKNEIPEALTLSKTALKFAIDGNFNKEKESIENNIKLLKEQHQKEAPRARAWMV